MMMLKPPTQNDSDFLDVLSSFLREYKISHPQFEVELENYITESQVPKGVKISILIIIEDLLKKMAQHCHAAWAVFSLSRLEGGIEFLVFDDGAGLELEELSRASNDRHWLVGIRMNAEATGGRISTIPGLEGTALRVFWPVTENRPRLDR